MKALLIKSFASLLISLFLVSLTQAQEYDDIYFRKSDRKKIKESRVKESPSYGKDSHLYDEIDKLEGENDDDNMLSEYQQNNQYDEDIEPNTIIEKHYYYNRPTSRYDRNFDDIFWSNPYLYQGTIFDPTISYYGNRSSYWRPGWSVSISFGNRWNRNRWRNRYWDRYDYGGYYNYGYYGNSWSYGYYDNYWCPPPYINRGNVITYSTRSGESRGVMRGRRYSRNSSINNGGRDSGRSGRSAKIISSGGRSNLQGKSDRSGRYSDNSRTYRNSNQTYNRNASTPRRRSPSNANSSNNSNSRTYSSGSRSTNRSGSRSNSYRSSSRSSSKSSSRSSNSTRSRSSNKKSKSSSPSRSSRTKRGN